MSVQLKKLLENIRSFLSHLGKLLQFCSFVTHLELLNQNVKFISYIFKCDGETSLELKMFILFTYYFPVVFNDQKLWYFIKLHEISKIMTHSWKWICSKRSKCILIIHCSFVMCIYIYVELNAWPDSSVG